MLLAKHLVAPHCNLEKFGESTMDDLATQAFSSMARNGSALPGSVSTGIGCDISCVSKNLYLAHTSVLVFILHCKRACFVLHFLNHQLPSGFPSNARDTFSIRFVCPK